MAEFDHRKEINNIPHKPGVYQYWDVNDQLIYIGKAKDLKNRVNSYFVNDRQLNAKTRVLVRKINKITFTLVDTEIDAWLLENSLIKKHQPRYNVIDRKSTRLNSSHVRISYAVFCLKKKTKK